MKFLSNKWVHILFLFGLLIGAVLFSASENDLRKRFQHFIFDHYNNIYQRPASDDIVIVDLDENSLRQVGQWPWPRDVMARLVDNLTQMGAKAIAFDIVFAEEDRTSPRNIIERLPNDEAFKYTKDKIALLPDNDEVFSQAIIKSGRVVTGFTAAKADETRRVPPQPIAPTFLLKNKENIIEDIYKTHGVATNLPIFSGVAAGNGHFMVSPEVDGIIRKVSLFSKYHAPQFENQKNVIYPSLSLEALRVSINPKARIILRENKNKSLFDLEYVAQIGKFSAPMESNAQFFVHYRDLNREEEYIPASFILNNQAAEKIKDKIVLVGTSAEGLRDIRSTPLERFVPGVEVHFNVLEQIIQGNYLTRPYFMVGAEAILLGGVGAAIIILAPFISVFILGALTLLSSALLFWGAWVGYVEKGLLLDPIYPSLILFLIFIASSLLSYMRSELDRRQVKNAFGHYISPAFMEELTKNPDKLKLGGEVKELSVMFTDIRSFTKISESLTPEELIQLMNDFLTPMSNLVMESRGTIDKYMGDAMMAFWNAPLDDAEHAYQACMTALKMNEALQPINEMLAEKAKAQNAEALFLSAGIGINTGLCSVGNMGSKQRFAYSALGDAVNLASRLEGQTKTYGVDNLVGEDTYKQQVAGFAFLELDLIQVVGRAKAVKIYTIMGDEAYANQDSFKKWQAAHNSMLAAYRIADFVCAAQDCKEAKELSDGRLDFYYDLYKSRIIEMTKTPPDENWSGVYVAKSK